MTLRATALVSSALFQFLAVCLVVVMIAEQKNEAQPGDSTCGSASQQQETSIAVKVDGEGDKGEKDAKDENKDTSFKYYLVSLCVSNC